MGKVFSCFKLLGRIFILSLVVGQAYAANPPCPRDALIKEVQAAIKKSGGTIEPVHLKDGIAIVITTKSADAIKAVHKSVDAYQAKRAKYVAPASDSYCVSMMKAIAAKQLTEQTGKTSTGALLLYGTADQMLVSKLHKDDCCNWCVCPAGTVTSCTRCC